MAPYKKNKNFTDTITFAFAIITMHGALNRMVRQYKRKINARGYVTYDKTTLEKAVTDVRDGRLSQRAASEQYGIPRSTLQNKLGEKHRSKPGHPTIFSVVEEEIFVGYLIKLSEWGFPMNELDLRLMVKGYLDRRGRTVTKFEGNLPGQEWASAFIKRHKDVISQRMCQNISQSRAGVDPSQIKTYFKNLENSLKDVPPGIIVNYDETNLSDDPGKKLCMFRRGVKYPERILNSRKGAISLMFAGSAEGDLLPVYVVYKAENLWDTWTQGGPIDARYNRSRSGWFDGVCFEDWFNTVAVPFLRRKPGKKVIIGDNLSSHFSNNVLQECERQDIHFVCLPANSTHLCQPLDVAFFRPLKSKWRKILTEWKQGIGRRSQAVNKDVFPTLLTKLLEAIEPQQRDNLVAGFRKCEIHPLNPQAILERLPSDENDQTDSDDKVANLEKHVSDSVIDMLKAIRYGEEGPAASKPKKRSRIEVEPGKSISAADISRQTDEEDESSDSDKQSAEETSDSDETVGSEDNIADHPDYVLKRGDWILVKYAMKTTSKYYVSHIIHRAASDTQNWEVQFCQKVSGKMSLFAYPEEMDVDDIDSDQVVRVLPKPDVNRHGQFRFDCSFDGILVN